MKKLLFVALAAVGMTACVQNEELAVAGGNVAIAFDNAYVYNPTRNANPTTTTESLEAFDVWAYMDEVAGTVLTDEDVTKVGGKWGYENIQYWMPNHTYYFAALAPANSNNVTETLAGNPAAQLGLGEIAFTNVNGTEDLLYAKAKVATGDLKSLTENGMDAVKLQFQHLLSKVRFTFKNGFLTNNMKVEVLNVEMTAPKAGTIDLAVADYSKGWVLGQEEITLDFGDVAELAATAAAATANERLTIPATGDYVKTYNVKFDVIVKSGDVVALTTTKEATISGYALEMGKAYNFTAVIDWNTLALPAIEFTAEVDEWDEEITTPVGDYVADAAGLQAALDAAATKNQGVNIYFGDDIDDNVVVNVPEIAGETIKINGNGKTFKGAFQIVGGSKYKNATSVFENINFVESTATKDAFIICNEQNGDTRYPDNVTIKGCTFTAEGKASVGAKFRSVNGKVVLEDCQATGMHSLLQMLSCGEAVVAIDNVTVQNSKNGISLQYPSKTTISNSTIATDEYAVRADGAKAYLAIENSTLSAKQPIVVRNMTSTSNFVLNVDAASQLVTAEPYAVVFTTGKDDAAYVAPAAGTYTFNCPVSYAYFPLVADASAVAVTSVEELNAALANAEVSTIVLKPAAYGTIVMKSNKTIVGQEGALVDCVVLNGTENITLKNIAFDAATAKIGYDGSGKAKQYANIVNDNNAGSNSPSRGAKNVVIDGCIFEGTFANGGAAIAFTDQNRKSGGSGNVTIKNCTFNTVGGYYHIYGHYTGDGQNGYGNFAIENNVFKSATQGKAVYLGRYASSTPVVVKGNAFAVASLENAVYVQAHSATYTVSVDASNNTFAN